ncbi:MAG: hypothetical protein ACRDT1_14700 [Micromonosporaceae bacterium]
MNVPVLVDWMTLLLAAIALVSAVCIVLATRSKSKAGGSSLPVWGKVAQGVAIVAVLIMALLNVWGG